MNDVFVALDLVHMLFWNKEQKNVFKCIIYCFNTMLNIVYEMKTAKIQ